VEDRNLSHPPGIPGAAASSSLSPARDGSNDNSPSEGVFNPPQHSPSSRDHDRIARRLALLAVPMPSYELVPKVDLTNRLPPESN